MENRRLYRFLLPPAAVLLIVLAVVLFFLFRAEQIQSSLYGRFAAMKANAAAMDVTVQEHGETVGVYDLETLGLLEQAQKDIDAGFDAISKMPPQEFQALTGAERRRWRPEAISSVTLRGEEADLSAILADLEKTERVPPKDAFVIRDGDQYTVIPEKPGTQLDREALIRELKQALQRSVTPESSLHPVVELSELPVYVQPSVTQESTFDYEAQLRLDMTDVKIPLQFFRTTKELDVTGLVTVTADGQIQVDEAGLEQAVADIAPKLSPQVFGYLYESCVQGEVPLDFLACTYELDQPALLELLKEKLSRLDMDPVEVPKRCLRDGAPYTLDLTETYLEVDIRRQKMTLTKDGQQLLQTDIVTGYPYGHWTPPGLYAVENKSTDDWLIGYDYQVFVEYWVGYDGEYGIHDASWRDTFGGDLYLTGGSHGCVNTPTDAMKTIYEHVEVGVPVIVFDAQPMQ